MTPFVFSSALRLILLLARCVLNWGKMFINVTFLTLYSSSFTANQDPPETQKQENYYIIK